MRQFRLTIDSLAFGGCGVGRAEGKVCFVPYACPGDELLVQVEQEKKSYCRASIFEILTPSNMRTEPLCALFGRCGGCDWQNVSYSLQLLTKKNILAQSLWKNCRTSADLVCNTTPSPQQYGYRSRVQFKLHGATGRFSIGFFRTGTHFVEDAPEGCPVALPIVNEAMAQLRALLSRFHEPDAIPQINIECGDDAAVAIIHYCGADSDRVKSFFTAARSETPSLSGLLLQTGRKHTLNTVWGEHLLHYTLPRCGAESAECRLSYAAGGFAQVNRQQNRIMATLAAQLSKPANNLHVLDLYCGNGNLSLPLANAVASVTGVEDADSSLASALANCTYNGIENAAFLRDDALHAVRNFAGIGRCFDIAILDPPRTGAVEVVKILPLLKPQRIVYVSCDPNTLARDCGILAGSGYRVVRSVPLDMFPQTCHLESVTLLELF